MHWLSRWFPFRVFPSYIRASCCQRLSIHITQHDQKASPEHPSLLYRKSPLIHNAVKRWCLLTWKSLSRTGCQVKWKYFAIVLASATTWLQSTKAHCRGLGSECLTYITGVLTRVGETKHFEDPRYHCQGEWTHSKNQLLTIFESRRSSSWGQSLSEALSAFRRH